MSWWRAQAIWQQPAEPGFYSAAGGEPLDFAAPVKEFTELDDAKRYRAHILQQHPNAVVSIEPTHQTGAGRFRPLGSDRGVAAIRQVRQQLARTVPQGDERAS